MPDDCRREGRVGEGWLVVKNGGDDEEVGWIPAFANDCRGKLYDLRG